MNTYYKPMSTSCKLLLLLFILLSAMPVVKAQISPEYSDNPKMQAFINKGDSLFFEGQFNQSASSYIEVVKTKYDSNVYLNICRAYVKLGDMAKFSFALKQLANSGFKDYWLFETEEDFSKVKDNEMVVPVRDQIKGNFKKYADSMQIRYPNLAVELLKMHIEDQKYQPMRAYMVKYANAYKNYNRDSLLVAIRKAFISNSNKLKHITAEFGFLGYKEVGKDAYKAGFFIAQHADSNKVFQANYLELMKIALKNNNASHNDFAYLTDRVRKGKGEKQVYGTQIVYTLVKDSVNNSTSVKRTPWPVEDDAKLNERRKEAGLPPIEEYLKFYK